MAGVQQEATRQKIMAAAEQEFRRFGPKKTSMEEIADSAGLSRATLYLHFSSKLELYEAVLRQVTESFIEEVAHLREQDVIAPQKFRQLVELTATTYTKNPLLLAALKDDNHYTLRSKAEPVMRDYRVHILGAIKAILKQGVAEGSVRKLDIEVTTYLLYEFGTQLLVKALDGSSEYPLKKTLDAMDNIISQGIRFEDIRFETKESNS